MQGHLSLLGRWRYSHDSDDHEQNLWCDRLRARARAGAIRQGRIDLLAGESKKEGMWGGDISIYRWLVANAMVGWCFARQERTNIRSLRAPDRYITFSSETGWEIEWSEQESARGREDVRLDGRQFESDV